jgi:hypothetical protein
MLAWPLEFGRETGKVLRAKIITGNDVQLFSTSGKHSQPAFLAGYVSGQRAWPGITSFRI